MLRKINIYKGFSYGTEWRSPNSPLIGVFFASRCGPCVAFNFSLLSPYLFQKIGLKMA